MGKLADLPGKEILNEVEPHSHSVTDPHMRGNNVTHCVTDLKVKEMNSSESCGCLAVDTENLSCSAPLVHQCSIIVLLYPVNQSICKTYLARTQNRA